MTRPDPLPPLRDAARAIAGAAAVEEGFAALQAATATAIGHRLFTVMRHDAAAGRNRRAFSSDPAAYPVSGFKPVTWDHPWTRLVLVQGQAWIGRDGADIAWAYPDHAKIAVMGLASAINLPVRHAGRVLGTINLLHGPGHFTEGDADVGLIFAGLAVPLLLGMDAG